jgi:putative endonuclease
VDRKNKGNKGEDMATAHLESVGFEVIERNYRYRQSEIDIIALKDNSLLVFVEVKLRTRGEFGTGETFVSANQERKIIEAAEEYTFAINWQKNIRFDIITVDGEGKLEWFEDAFY